VLCSQASSLLEVAGDSALTFDPECEDELIDGLTQFMNQPNLCTELRQRGTMMNQADISNGALGNTLRTPFTDEIYEKSLLARFVSQIKPTFWPYILLVSDTLLIFVAFQAAYFIRYRLQWFRAVEPASELSFGQYAPFTIALLVILPVIYGLSGIYPYRKRRGLFEEIYDIVAATTMGVILLITASLIFRPLLHSRLIYLYAAFSITLLLGISRFLILQARLHLRRYGIGVERMLLVGAGDVGRMVMRNVVAKPSLGYQVVGFLDDSPTKSYTDIGPFPALGPVENFDQVLRNQQVDNVIICLPWQSHRRIQRLLRSCDRNEIRAHVVPDFFQLTKDQIEVEELNGVPLISRRKISLQGWNLAVKRGIDLLFTFFMFLFTWPIILSVSVAIWLETRGSVLYTQTRLGKDGKPFEIYKFRSMVEGAHDLRHELEDYNESSGPLFKLRHDPRCTRVGRFIRRFSLDEFPQMINVVRGEMSWVGPRPNLPEEVDQYEEWHKKRLSVKSGMTGLWQVSGRSDLTFDEMVLLDIYYTENWSIFMDLGIMLRSLPAMMRGSGAY